MPSLCISEAARRHAGRLALVLPGGRRVGYAELAAVVQRVAAVLDQWGGGPGRGVALRAPTSEASLLVTLAAMERGSVLVPLHPRLTDLEAAALLEASAPACVVGEAELVEIARRAPAEKPLDPGPAPRGAATLAVLFTSGTTGRPKGALLSRRAFAASAQASARNLPFREGDRWLLTMPLCHVGGLSVVTRALSAGGAIVLQQGFEPEAVLASVREDGASVISVVPTMLRRLLEADRANELAQVRALLVGGAACPPPLLEECARRGVLALTTYGLTEACSQVATQAPRDPHTAEPGCGRALPGTELAFREGRILVRGPTLMDGYLGEPPLTPGAWFDTGDLGELDPEGRLHVHARRTDLVVTGGENVYPAEVEAALEACPGVRRALVFGVPDEEWGQLVACALERDPDRPVPEPELLAALAARLASHKRPRRVCFVEALPTRGEKLDRAGGARAFAAAVRAWETG